MTTAGSDATPWPLYREGDPEEQQREADQFSERFFRAVVTDVVAGAVVVVTLVGVVIAARRQRLRAG